MDKSSEEEALAVAEAKVIEPIAPKKRLCKYLKILIPVAIIAILGCIAFSFIRSITFRCRIVDEFYDDTSNHWGYNHSVFETEFQSFLLPLPDSE